MPACACAGRTVGVGDDVAAGYEGDRERWSKLAGEATARLSVEEIYSGLDFRRYGRYECAVCPFHPGARDRNFKVNTDTKGYRCWSQCGQEQEDSAASYVMRQQGLSFSEAAQALARLAGIKVPSGSRPSRSISAPTPARPRPAPPRAELPRLYPPADEVLQLWHACVRVDEAPRTAAYLRAHNIDPTMVADLDIARALLSTAVPPRWATRYAGGPPWPHEGYEMIVPFYDARGVMRSMKARNVVSPDKRRKNRDGEPIGKSFGPYLVRPEGEPGYTYKGLCFACPTARHMLQTGRPPADWPAGRDPFFEFVEGEKKFTLRASLASDADECVPAVIGMVNGSWTDDLAARFPARSTILTVTDVDSKGATYATTLLQSIWSRVLRSDVSIELRPEYVIEHNKRGGLPCVQLTPEIQAAWEAKQTAKRRAKAGAQ
jgi:CHC2 zinc finger